MIRIFRKFTLDEAIVGIVFDHFRNLSVISLLFGAGAWKQARMDDVPFNWWDLTSATLLDITAFALAWLNHAHLQVRLRSHNAPRWIIFAFYLFYVVGFTELYRYVRNN